MKEIYEKWIEEHVKNPRAQCEEITRNMQNAFPELTRIRGFYCCLGWRKSEHWWLQDKDGNIVDPTKSQFRSQGGGEYEGWSEGAKEPTRKCLNCGGYSYDYKQCCCDSCYKEFLLSLKR